MRPSKLSTLSVQSWRTPPVYLLHKLLHLSPSSCESVLHLDTPHVWRTRLASHHTSHPSFRYAFECSSCYSYTPLSYTPLATTALKLDLQHQVPQACTQESQIWRGSVGSKTTYSYLHQCYVYCTLQGLWGFHWPFLFARRVLVCICQTKPVSHFQILKYWPLWGHFRCLEGCVCANHQLLDLRNLLLHVFSKVAVQCSVTPTCPRSTVTTGLSIHLAAFKWINVFKIWAVKFFC